MFRPERVAALAALLCASAAAAVPVPAPPLGPPSSSEVRNALAQAVTRGRAGDCAGLLGALDPLVARSPAGVDRNALQLIRLPCLIPAGRAGEVGAVQRELAQAAPQNPMVRSYGVLIAASEGRFSEAAEKLEAIATEAPAALALVPGASWRGIAQQLTQEKNVGLRGRVTIALARADWQPADRPDMRDALAQGAVEALLRDGQVSEASVLLDRIEAPELLFGMATERTYQPLWPQIEARMGPAQARSVDRFAAERLDVLSRGDEDARARRDGIRAFLMLGRYADADELAAPVKIADGISEDAVASVRYHAQALAAQGRRDEAIARMQPFATLDFAHNPLAAGGIVGLAELLDESGRAEQALTVARAGLANPGAALSPWGLGWLRRTEVCALTALGRASEAKAKGDALLAAAADNEAAAIEGMLCAARRDEAAKLAIRTLGSDDGASRLADQFQPDGAIWAPSGSRLRALWAPLLARPDVKAAFEKVARILPKLLWPSREPRPIPPLTVDRASTT